ncbi:hypothetical protein [Agriterribacter sp.]|uniref:hypothetical protein n=1 Tax=Agriterribacter sp. TaxID=2821509 RepID=UPI002D1774BA|nr:hypothetical protein [Agriterribacter sp.]HRP58430.1 hypothetical protein [Agriterribacter sp.]
MITVIPPAKQNHLLIPDSFQKGEQFEDYVRRHLFPKAQYKLIHRTPGYLQNEKDYPESSLKPDFTLQDILNGRSFYVECKFRSALIANSYPFSKKYQLERYKSYTDLPFYLVLGLGGKASAPNQVFLLNFFDSQFAMLYKRHLNGREIQKDMAVQPSQLWKNAAA